MPGAKAFGVVRANTAAKSYIRVFDPNTTYNENTKVKDGIVQVKFADDSTADWVACVVPGSLVDNEQLLVLIIAQVTPTEVTFAAATNLSMNKVTLTITFNNGVDSNGDPIPNSVTEIDNVDLIQD